MRTITWMLWGALLAAISSGANGVGLNVLIIGNDPHIAELSNGLASFSDFHSTNTITWSTAPSASLLNGYDAVVVTEDWKPLDNSAAWGNIIADFAQNGGSVTCGFAYYSDGGPPTDYGRLALPTYNPFTRGPILGQTGTLGEILVPGSPLIAGVEQLTTDYRYNIAANRNAVVVACFNDGLPLAGYLNVGSGRVVGIQAHYRLNPWFLNSGDYMQLYRNAILTSVPEPASILLLALGGLLIARRRPD